MNKFEVRNMDLYYGSFHALKNINIDIPEKEITAFIGPSGCGKSTFLKSLNRMNDLVEGCRISGDIKLDGVDIYKDKMDVNVLRKRVGMVFQKPNPFPMSIYDNIAYGPRTHGIHNKAMQRRCCWPPDMPRALLFRRSLTSSQMAAPRRDLSTISSSCAG